MPSRLFTDGRYAAAMLELLRRHETQLRPALELSPRAAGDAIQSLLSAECRSVLGDLCAEYSSEFARRAMADWAFTDVDGYYYIVDVKTHRQDSAFNMPNLVSVERLCRFYEDDRNYFVILLVKYAATRIEEVLFIPIEYLAWECLTIGALGWGQVQIANASKVIVNAGQSRRQWMLQLCEVMSAFYPHEIEKINERIAYFERVRQDWMQRE